MLDVCLIQFPFLFKIQVPFNAYFQVEPLKQYHDVVLMKDFMENEAKEIWPSERRIGKASFPKIIFQLFT